MEAELAALAAAGEERERAGEDEEPGEQRGGREAHQHEHDRALGRGIAGDEEQADAEGEVAEVHRLDATHQHEPQGRDGQREDGVELALDGHGADAPRVGEQPERQATRRRQHCLEHEDRVAVPPAERADLIEEQHPEDHPHEVVDRHDQHLDAEGARLRRHLREGVAARVPEPFHPPTTSRRRSPERNAQAATTARAPIQATCSTSSHGSQWPDASRAGA